MKNSEDKKIELNEFFLMGMLAKYLATFITKHIRRLDFEAFFDRNFLHFGIKIPQMLYPVLRASKVFGRLLRAQKEYFDIDVHGEYVQLDEFIGKIADVTTITTLLATYGQHKRNTQTSVGRSPSGDYGLRLVLHKRFFSSGLLNRVTRLPFFKQSKPSGSEGELGFMNNKKNISSPRRALLPAREEYEIMDLQNEDIDDIVFTPDPWNSQFGHNVINNGLWTPLENLVDWKEFNFINEELLSIKRNIMEKMGKVYYIDPKNGYSRPVKVWQELKYSTPNVKKYAIDEYSKNVKNYVNNSLEERVTEVGTDASRDYQQENMPFQKREKYTKDKDTIKDKKPAWTIDHDRYELPKKAPYPGE